MGSLLDSYCIDYANELKLKPSLRSVPNGIRSFNSFKKIVECGRPMVPFILRRLEANEIDEYLAVHLLREMLPNVDVCAIYKVDRCDRTDVVAIAWRKWASDNQISK